MSIVIVDIDNQYEDSLCDSYQLIKEDDETYSVYIAHSILRGRWVARKIESFDEAFILLVDTVKENEYIRD